MFLLLWLLVLCFGKTNPSNFKQKNSYQISMATQKIHHKFNTYKQYHKQTEGNAMSFHQSEFNFSNSSPKKPMYPLTQNFCLEVEILRMLMSKWLPNMYFVCVCVSETDLRSEHQRRAVTPRAMRRGLNHGLWKRTLRMIANVRPTMYILLHVLFTLFVSSACKSRGTSLIFPPTNITHHCKIDQNPENNFFLQNIT